jgi:hypothetical protein
MKNYEKPMIIANDELAEGVYATTSGATSNGAAASGTAVSGCDSIYMQGHYQAADFNKQNATYGERLGCTGCPAFAYNYCQLEDYYRTQYTSYEVDNGNRRPAWETKGHTYDELIDWNTYDL